ncbi:MAG TPA: TetR/AcrR family transcriptional regulator [Acidimicrobiia bacterium]|nr:TetR/AcrR family transcriptional regulator [Acidimicrobiia bacterium]
MSPTRRELVRATRARIIEAAGRLTRERGPNGFSMDQLAKEAGVARATVYEHFRSKRAVLDELAATIAKRVAIEEPRAPTGDPLTALRDMLRDACLHWSEHEERMRGLRTLTAITGTEPSEDAVDDKQLRRLVEALDAAGQMRPHWSIDEAVDALGALTSYSMYERLRRAPRTAEQVEAVLAKLVVSMVNPGAATAPSTATAASTAPVNA